LSWILGINAFHGDSSACLLRNGVIVGAAEEERFRRIKHWAGFPSQAIRWCLEDAGIGIGDVEHVALNQDSKANLGRKLAYTLTKRPELGLLLDRIRNKRERAGVAQHLAGEFPGEIFKGKVHAIEHHLAHLSSAFHVSPFENAVVASVDGFGDFASAAWGVGKGIEIDVDERVYFPHSLGIFYQALTQFLGFPNYGDEYKVMGLAPYGEPRYLATLRELVVLQRDGSFRLNLDYFRHAREKVDMDWENGSPSIGTLYSEKLRELLGAPRAPEETLTQDHYDIARSVQAMYEEAFFHLLNALHQKYGLDSLCLAGGCAMNSVANGKITVRSPFKHVYVQSAAGDAGGAIGAAFVVWHQLNGARAPAMNHAYLGPCYSDETIGEMLKARADNLSAADCAVEYIEDEGDLCKRTAKAIAAGQVIGWFQGRMEWGPRALGNRSIVCDPRRADMKDILNLKIKRRESFRPFAPSILRKSVPDWFEIDGDVPFMMQVYPIRAEKRGQIPAVTHVDGSGRLQTVDQSTNPRYYRLIEAFREISGVPLVLNTSFNENEPVVCTPKEALECFLRTKMDVLVLGRWYLSREQVVLSAHAQC